jgi:hypothetical protein
MISYRSSLRFVPVQWYFGRVVTLGLWNLAKYLVVTTFCDMLGDIDLIFGTWVYNDELQIKFHSGPMIFGRAMACGLWNLAKYLVVSPLYFTMIWYIDLIFWYACIIIWNSFRLNDFLPTCSRWVLKFGHIFSCHHFFSLWFEILTWFLVCEYTDALPIKF